MDKTHSSLPIAKELEEELLKPTELARHLKIPCSWVYSRTRESGPDKIPMIKVGKYVRFRLKDVLAWLETRYGK